MSRIIRRAPLAIPALMLPLLGAATMPCTSAPPDWEPCLTSDPDTAELLIDPECLFDVLVARYRRLAVYEDTSRVTQIVQREGQAPRRLETRVDCEVDHDSLSVQTTTAQMRRESLLRSSFRTSPAWDSAAMRYRMWLAPHLALKFAPRPIEEFRSGVHEGFTATEAKSITVGDRAMLHLELKSGDGRSEDPDASFELYVNPDSMLVEKITGQQRLPGGGWYETTVEITPTVVENEVEYEVDHEPAVLPATGPAADHLGSLPSDPLVTSPADPGADRPPASDTLPPAGDGAGRAAALGVTASGR